VPQAAVDPAGNLLTPPGVRPATLERPPAPRRGPFLLRPTPIPAGGLRRHVSPKRPNGTHHAPHVDVGRRLVRRGPRTRARRPGPDPTDGAVRQSGEGVAADLPGRPPTRLPRAGQERRDASLGPDRRQG